MTIENRSHPLQNLVQVPRINPLYEHDLDSASLETEEAVAQSPGPGSAPFPTPLNQWSKLHAILAIVVLVPATVMGLGIGVLYLLAMLLGPISCGGAPDSGPAPQSTPAPAAKPVQPR